MQPDAAASSNTQLDETSLSDEFTISVEQVRQHFQSKGVPKSKDTVQRWCRNGDLTCQKRGVLNRYFTTETSLKKLERKLIPDMIADTSGEVSVSEKSVQPDAAASAAARTGMQLNEDARAAARSGAQVHEDKTVQLHAAAPVEESIGAPITTDLSRLTAENEGLREQLKNRDSQIEFLQEQIEFLQEEIRSGREQRGAVVQISNRMLETLETMAIGGRLERPKTSDPVRYETAEREADGV